MGPGQTRGRSVAALQELSAQAGMEHRRLNSALAELAELARASDTTTARVSEAWTKADRHARRLSHTAEELASLLNRARRVQ